MINQTKEIEKIYPLLDKWYGSQNGKRYGLNVSFEAVVKDIKKLLNSEYESTIFIAGEKEAEGFLLIFKMPSLMGNQYIGVEKYWYVRPESRRYGRVLYSHAENWCKENGCTHFVMCASNLASDMHDKVCRFYEKMGMKLFETTYVKEI